VTRSPRRAEVAEAEEAEGIVDQQGAAVGRARKPPTKRPKKKAAAARKK
jgi:hypothetical protein